MLIWNPWHGCHKVSEGCLHCYMYFLDSKRDIDTSRVFRTENFDLPLQRRRDGSFRIRPGSTIQVGLSTDFFVEEADAWRGEAWEIIAVFVHSGAKIRRRSGFRQSLQVLQGRLLLLTIIIVSFRVFPYLYGDFRLL